MARHPVRAARNLAGNRSSRLADRYLRGLRGVEIGGTAHNDFFLDTINVDYTREPSTAPAQLRHAGRVMDVDVVAPADALPFADDEFDFVLASHVIEHMPDPIKALGEWARVASRFLHLIIPARTNPFDRDRPLTTVAELEERHRSGFDPGEDRHWSVWTPESFRALCVHIGLDVAETQEPDDKRGNGFAVVVSL